MRLAREIARQKFQEAIAEKPTVALAQYNRPGALARMRRVAGVLDDEDSIYASEIFHDAPCWDKKRNPNGEFINNIAWLFQQLHMVL